MTDYQSIFDKYDGVMRTYQIQKEKISYQNLQELIKDGSVEKIKYGYYQWQDDKSLTDVSIVVSLFPDAILCDMSALNYYGYCDRISPAWHIAVDSKSNRNKYKLDYPKIKAHFIKNDRLNIGETTGNIDGVNIKIYDRERVICDCLRHMDRMDKEIFNQAIKSYIKDNNKNSLRLMDYAKKLGVESKARNIVGVWL